MKVTVKTISNGWMVSWPIYNRAINYSSYNVVLEEVGTAEKAFTYDFKDEFDATWGKVLDFITSVAKGGKPT